MGAEVIAGAPSSPTAKPKNPRLPGAPESLLVDVEVVAFDVVEDLAVVVVVIGELVLDTRQVQALDSLLGMQVVGIYDGPNEVAIPEV